MWNPSLNYASYGGLSNYSNSAHASCAQEPPADAWTPADLQPLVDFVENAILQGKLLRDPLIPVSVEPSKEVFERVRDRWEGLQL